MTVLPPLSAQKYPNLFNHVKEERDMNNPSQTLRLITLHIPPSNPIGSSDVFVYADMEKVSAGGAPHRYLLTQRSLGVITELNFPTTKPNPTEEATAVTMEALLAVCADRLEAFQAGPFPCDHNHLALVHIKQALAALHGRTLALGQSSEPKLIPPESIPRESVQSSQIKSMGYDPLSQQLVIEFIGRDETEDGPIYGYTDVPPSLFAELRAAPSIGKFFSARIRPRGDLYPCKKLV